MIRWLARVVIFHIIIFIAAGMPAYSMPDTLEIPASLQQQLQALRNKDDLEGWIYQRISFTDEQPAARISFLMHTQQAAWRTYRNYAERLAWFDLLALQGYYQLQTGNILTSISAYESALQFYESYPLPDADIIEYVLKPLGNNYTRLADYNTALFIHRKTLSIAMQRRNRNTIASVYSNMAACARWKGDLQEANRFCREGIAQVDKKSLLYGLLLSTWADVLAEQHRYDTAAILCRQSLRQLQRHGSDMQALYWYSSALQIASRIALHEGNYPEALQYAQAGLRLFRQYFPHMRRREKAKLFVLMGDILLQKQNHPQALEQYQEALRLLLPAWKPAALTDVPPENLFYSENTIGDALAGKAAALQFTGKTAEALSHYIASFAATRKLRAAFFYEESAFRELEVTRSRADAAMRLAYSAWLQTHHKKYREQLLLIAEWSKAQVLQDERAGRMVNAFAGASDSLVRKLKQLQEAVNYYQHESVEGNDTKGAAILLQSAEYELALLMKTLKQRGYHAYAESSLTAEQLHGFYKKIPAYTTVLEIFEGTDSSFIIELDATGIQAIYCIPEGRKLRATMQQFLHRWFGNGPAAMINTPKEFFTESHALYKAVFGNYSWKTDRHYVIIPDGLFNFLPFDALITEPAYRNNYKEWPCLFRKVSTSRAWSLRTWCDQQDTKYPAGPFNGFYVALQAGTMQPALSVEKEYDALHQLLTGTHYANEEATWEHFNEAAGHAGILHIGSHALSASGDSIPCLQLYDRPFYLFDLRYKKFSPALVVLGACKTADGMLLEGEGINSLSRGFTAAGAGGVVSGLWNVNDETAILLMQFFYRNLQRNDAAKALREAQNEWLASNANNPVLQLPYYWSGFIYNGHLQKVPLQAKKNDWWFYVTGLLVVLTGLFFLHKFRRKI